MPLPPQLFKIKSRPKTEKPDPNYVAAALAVQRYMAANFAIDEWMRRNGRPKKHRR